VRRHVGPAGLGFGDPAGFLPLLSGLFQGIFEESFPAKSL